MMRAMSHHARAQEPVPTLPAIARPLLAWYDREAADLPWRGTRDPYRVWLSEVMLQQSRIATVRPYYERFVAAYPTVEALAAAPLDAVLKQWEGLGYYSRARHLHQTAGIIAREHGGRFPLDSASLQALPGIGRYTAGAIASIVSGEPVPVLDGNVIRVLARLIDLPDNVARAQTRQQLWALAAQGVPAERPGDYNQAIMELGQKICRPRQPRCAECPLQALCLAHARGTQASRPVKTARGPVPHYDVAAGVIEDERGHLLIAQRPLEGLLGGLWEFPGGKCEPGETLPDALARELREELAIEVAIGDRIAQVRHAFTHFRITLHAYECRYIGPLAPYDAPQTFGVRDWRWVPRAGLGDYSFGKADRAVIDVLHGRQPRLL
jgi:A/G-specific adenine glycosylase